MRAGEAARWCDVWAPLSVGVTSQEAVLVFGVFPLNGQSGTRCGRGAGSSCFSAFPGTACAHPGTGLVQSNRHFWNAHCAPGCVLHDLANPLEMLRGHSSGAEVAWGRPRTRVLCVPSRSAKQKALPDRAVVSVPSSVTGPVSLAVLTRGADEVVVRCTLLAVQMAGSLPLAGSRNLLCLTSSLSSTGPAMVSSFKMLSKWASECCRWNLPFLFAHASFR